MKKTIKSNLFIYLGMLLGSVSFYLVIVFGQGLFFQNKIPMGVTVAGVVLSGKTSEEAKSILAKKVEEYQASKIVLSGKEDKEIALNEVDVQFDVESTVKKAEKNRKNPFVFKKSENLEINFTYSQDKLYKKFTSEEKVLARKVSNSKIKKQKDGIEVTDGVRGERLNFAESENNFRKAIGNLENYSQLSHFNVGPTFSKTDIIGIENEIAGSLSGPLKLKYKEKEFSFPEEEIFSWVQVSSKERVLANRFEREELLNPIFGINEGGSLFSEAEIKGSLIRIKGEVDQKPVNAQLQVKDGRAAVFVPSKGGQSLNLDETADSIATALTNRESEVEIVVDEVNPEITESSLNDMGIVELIASGNSTYAGSPENRKHNIRTGASKFNGVLIKPDEVFSFNNALGPVDASTGYLPELVILENKTQPQFGGGLCQVSSTAFRAALNSGLPITERKAHAYPVTYYKPFGVDATIYLPKPDLVFKNDTGKYILIQTRIEGTKLFFDFYGTKPKRSIKFAGNEKSEGSVSVVESVNPAIYDQGVRGNGSFTAAFWRFIYDETGKLVNTKNFVSKYDSPDKYPH